MSNINVYTKRVWTEIKTPKAEVFRNGKSVEWKWWVLYNTSVKNQEKHLIKAHQWADDMIAMLNRQETSDGNS